VIDLAHLHMAAGVIDALTQAQQRDIAARINEMVNRQMEEVLFGGRKQPDNRTLTVDVIVAPRKSRPNPFGIINWENVA
jgi:hypothetical protein